MFSYVLVTRNVYLYLVCIYLFCGHPENWQVVAARRTFGWLGMLDEAILTLSTLVHWFLNLQDKSKKARHWDGMLDSGKVNSMIRGTLNG
jgi:hypothetical protein